MGFTFMFILKDGWRRNEAVDRESVVQASFISVQSVQGTYNRINKRLATKLKTHLTVIHGRLTSQLQPLDVPVNKPFKGFMREEWAK